MKISQKEFEIENAYLEKVRTIAKDLIKEKNREILEKRDMVISGKKHLWQNLNEYTGAEMHTTMDDRDLDVSIINADIVKVAHLERSLENPFFGRVDFNSEPIYIGITGIDKDFTSYVYDWRAPISNLYYNSEKGQTYYDTPKGKIEGTLSLKRQYKIEMGHLIDAFDVDMAIDDEMLQDVLLSSSDEHMKNIVSTIQKEQNEVIRFGGKRDLIIEGVAGSGKTSVALHRIAYLLYNNKNLTNENVLILSPNDIFTEYISDVLPELGEESVDTITFERLVSKVVKGIELESVGEFLEKVCESPSKLSDNVREKFDISYADKIDAFVKEYVNGLTFKKKIGLKKKFITSDELNKMFKESASSLSLIDRLDYVANKICDLYDVDIDKYVPKLIEILKGVLDIETDPIKLYRQFTKDDTFGLDKKVPYEDISGLLYLYFSINGYPTLPQIRHIVIDEAQDYTMLEFRMLKRIFKSALFTILGDKNQTINPYLKYPSLELLKAEMPKSVYSGLTKTYRSSPEIIDFTNKIISITDVKSVRRPTGREVIMRNNTDIYNIIDDIELLKKDYNRVAIITKTKKDTDEITAILENTSPKTLSKLLIVPSYLAKGLEYDAVIVYTDEKNSFKKEEANLYYVAATRAQHALIVYNQ